MAVFEGGGYMQSQFSFALAALALAVPVWTGAQHGVKMPFKTVVTCVNSGSDKNIPLLEKEGWTRQ